MKNIKNLLIDKIETIKIGDIVEFGSYPQSLKEKEVSIQNCSPTDKGYYIGSDNCNYEFYREYYYKVEPLLWKILDIKEDKILLFSERILLRHEYSLARNNYKKSKARLFINNEFYNKAFTKEEQEKIIPTLIDNSLFSTTHEKNPYVCKNTFDKIYLLSLRDITNPEYGFNENTEEDENRCKKITSYAANSGAASDNEGNGYYYLRTPSFYEFESEYTVLNDGSILSSSLGNTGIAPALWIKIK